MLHGRIAVAACTRPRLLIPGKSWPQHVSTVRQVWTSPISYRALGERGRHGADIADRTSASTRWADAGTLQRAADTPARLQVNPAYAGVALKDKGLGLVWLQTVISPLGPWA